MRRKFGIVLLILLNLTFIWIISLRAVLAFGLMVLPLEKEKALEITRSTSQDILIEVVVVSGIVFLINSLILKKMVTKKKPFLKSLIFTLVATTVIIMFFISARQSFLNYQLNTQKNKENEVMKLTFKQMSRLNWLDC